MTDYTSAVRRRINRGKALATEQLGDKRHVRWLGLYKLQSAASLLALWGLTALVGWWEIPILLVWAMAVTAFYEHLVNRGLVEDLMAKQSWGMMLLGPQTFVITHVSKMVLRPRMPRKMKEPLMLAACIFLGPVQTHHLLKHSGYYNAGQVKWRNLLLRIPEAIQRYLVTLSLLTVLLIPIRASGISFGDLWPL